MAGKRGTLIKLFVANVLISLLWASKRLNEILEVCFKFLLILMGNGFNSDRTVMLRTQMLVHRWGPKTRGLALFDRGT